MGFALRTESSIRNSLDSIDRELGLWRSPDERGDVIYRMMKAYRHALNWALSFGPSQSNIAERLDRTKRALIKISRRVPYSSGSWYIVSSYRDALVWLFDEQALGTVGLAHSSPPIHQTHRKARARSTLAKIA